MRRIVLLLFLISASGIVSPAPAIAAGKRIEINLTRQQLIAYEDDRAVQTITVSTGKRRTPTPVGTYRPWIKLRYDDMRGGSRRRGDYYYLKNVPYVVYFHGPYAIHGTYWHNRFGVPVSHGCINVPTRQMAKLYSWIEMDTPIIITGTTPR